MKLHTTNIKQLVRVLFFAFCLSGFITKVNAATYYSMGSGNFTTSAKLWSTDSLSQSVEPTITNMTNGTQDFVVRRGHKITIDDSKIKVLSLKINEKGTVIATTTSFTVQNITVNDNFSLLIDGILDLGNFNHATLNNAKINNSKGTGEIKIGGVAWSGLSSIAGTFFTTRTNTLTFYNSGYTLTSLPISIPTLTIEGSGIVFPSINTLIGDININTPTHTFTNALNTNLCNINSNANGKLTLNTWNLSGKTFIKSGISVIVNLGGSVADSLVNEGNLTLITTASLNTVKFLNKGTLTLGNNAIGDGPTAFSKFQNLVIVTNGASIQANNYTFKDVIFQGSIAMANKIYTAENVTLDSNKVTTITFSGGGTLNVNKTLTMRSISPTLNTKIDITATAVTNITIGGDLVGDGNSTINGGSAGVITLKGVNNSLKTLSGTGSTVIYAGTSKQNMFASTNYQKLTINNSSGVTMKGASTVISALTLTSGRLQIGDYNLALASPNASNSATTSSWIHTDGSGTVTSMVGGTYKYYVGNDTHAQTIQMNNSALFGVNSVRFGTSSISKPASAVGSWYISNSGSGMQLQFINPQGGTLNSGSLVFNKTTSSWKSNITAYGGSPVPTYTSSTPSSGQFEYTLFSCPTLSISGSFTNGSTSNPYSQTVAILSGTAPFLISNITGVPSGLSLSVNNTTGIVTLSGTPTNASTGNIISFNYTDNSGCSFTYTNPAFDILLLDLSPTTVTAATNVSNNGFTVNWKACAAPFVVLQVSSDPNFATAEVTVNNLTGSSTNRIVTKSNFISFDPTKIYYARVQTASTNSSTDGQYSNIKIVYVPSKPGSGNALSFNGSQYANVGADTSFNYNQTDNFTIEAWVKLETTAIGKYVIFSKRTQNSPWNGYGILLENTGTNVNFLVDYGNSTSGSVIPGFTLNTWNHIAVSFQGTNYTYYCNGILIGSGAGLSFPKTNDIPRIGTYNIPTNYFKGSIDEVRIWNTNLPLNTIQTNMCKKLTGSEANLVGYFNFDEGMGNTSENKAVVASSDATLINAPIWQTSGAPIGDISTFKYAGSSITLNDNDNFTASGYTLGSNQGIHIYKVKQTPNAVNFGSGIDSLQLNQYWGVFPIGITNYTTSYDYTTNVANGKTYEGGILLSSRIDNTGTSWNKISTANADVVNNTIITPLITTGRSEIIAGFGAINNFWNGTINTDWNNAGNWSAGAVPTNSHAVTISSTASNQPIISSNATAQSITIQSAAKLTLNSGVTLAVTNSISNNGTICNGGTISGTIVGTPFVVNPFLSYTANPICSNNAANITLTSSAGATVLWSRASVVGISQPASSGTGTLISEVLTSTNATSTNVLYLATATLGGCTSPQTSISLVVNPTPTATISGTSTICAGSNASLSVNFTGNQPFRITYTDGTTPVIINGISSSTYTFTVNPTSTQTYTLSAVNDANCTGTVSGSAIVTVNPNLIAGTIGSAQTICNNTAPNTLTNITSPSGGTGTYTYQWQSSSNNITWSNIAGATTSSYSPGNLTSDTYFRRQVSSGSCNTVNSTSVLITINSIPTATISGNNTICAGSSTNLTINFTGKKPWSYLYSDGTIQTAVVNTYSSNSTITVNPTATTNFFLVSMSDSLCTGTVSGNAIVTVNPNLIAGTIGSAQTICNNTAPNTLTNIVSPSGGTGTYTYQWQSSSNNITWSNIAGATTSSYSPGNLTSDTYFRRQVSSGSCNTVNSASVLITINSIPTATISGNNTICAGSSTNLNLVFTGSVPWSVTYSDGTTSITLTNISTSPYSIPVNPSTTKTYTISSVSDGSSCTGTVSGSAIVTVNPNLIAGTIGSAQTICNNTAPNTLNNITSPSGGTGTYTYQWQSSSNNITWSNIAGATTSSYSPGNLTSDTYFRRQVSSGSCNTVNSASVLITINSIPTATISGNNTICAGSSTNLTINFTGKKPWSYLYSDGTIQTAVVNTYSSNSTITVNPTATTNFFLVSMSDSLCTGTISGNANVTVNPLPVISPNPDQIVCDGSAFSTINFNSIPLATTFNWTNSVPTIGLGASGTGNSISSFGAVNTSSTQVDAKIIVTPVLNSCIGKSDTLILSVKPKPTLTAVSNQTYCANVNTSQINFGSVPSSGTTYAWTNSNSSIGLPVTGSGNVPTFLTSNAGNTPIVSTINVTPTLNGCNGNTLPFTITVNPIPILSAIPNQTYCAGNIVPASNFASNIVGTTFSWTNDNPSIGMIATGVGNYVLFTATNTGSSASVGNFKVTPTANTCVGSTQNFTITVNPQPIATIGFNVSKVCKTGTNPVLSLGSGATAGTFTIPSGLAINQANGIVDLANTAAGTYVVTNTIPANGGCIAVSDTANLTINPSPIAGFNYSSGSVCKTGFNPTIVFKSGAIAGTFSSTPSGLSINTSTGAITLSVSNIGTYKIYNTIAASAGCAATKDSTILTITNSPDATFSYAGSPYCNSNSNPSATFSGGASGGVFSAGAGLVFLNTNTGLVDLKNSTPGTYTVTNTIAAAGCSTATANNTITIQKASVADFTYTGKSFCDNASNPSPSFIAGGVAGNFIANPSGLSINPSTGLVNLSTSTPGKYLVTNTISAIAACPQVSYSDSIIITKLPNTSFTISNAIVCKNSINPTTTLGSGAKAGVFSASPSGLFIDPTSGAIDLFSSNTGTYTVTNTISASGGCGIVSSTQAFTISPIKNSSYSISACESYFFNGLNRTVSSTYLDTLTSKQGCDSIITLNLTIKQPSTKSLSQTACSSYFFNGLNRTVSGFYNDTLVNAAGCDSIITLNLTIKQPSTKSLSQTACGSYLFNGLNINVSGIYKDTLMNAQGCDSIITLNLTIKQPSTKSLSQTACGSYLFNGLNINVSGIYKDTLMNAQGCDSIITLNLTIKQPSAKSLTQTACGSYLFNGLNINVSGIYKDTLMNAQGCDSIITLNLTINPLPKVKATASVNPVCLGAHTKLIGTGANSYTWDYGKIDNQLFNPTKDTLYTVTGKDVNNCTATDTITIKVQNCTILSATISGSDTICNGDITPLKIDLTGKAPWNVVYNNGFVDKTITGILTSPYFENVGPPISTTYKLISVTDSLLNTSTNVNGIATIVLQAKPLVNAGNNTLICNNASQIQLNGSVKNAPSKWLTTGSGSFANSQSDTTIYTLSTNDKSLTTIFFYLESDSKFCSKVIDTLEYTLDKYPTANAGNDTTICDNLQIVYLHGKKTGAPTGVTWTSNGSGIFNNQNASNADYTFSTNDLTKSSIAFYMKTTGGLGVCPQVEDTVNVSFKATPKLTFVTQMDTICNGERFGIKVKSSVASASILWSTNDDAGIIPSASGTGDSLSTIPVGLGVLDYQFVATSNGCESKYLLGSVVLKNCLKANYTVNKSSVTNLSDTIIFTSTSTGGTIDSYTWNFGTDANPQTSNSAGPIKVVFSKTGKKVVSLTIKSGALSNTYIDSLVEIKSTSKLQIIVSDSTVEQSKDSVNANLNVINGKKYKWISEPLGAVTFSDSSANPVIKFTNGISGKITVKAIVTFNDNSVDSSEVLIVRNGEYQISVTKTKAYYVDSIPVTVNFKGTGPFEFKYQIGKDSSTIKGITTNAYTFNVLSPGQLNVLRIFDKDNVPINYVGGVFPYIVLDTVTSVKHSSTTTFCTAASSKLFVDIKGGKAPYIITIGTNNYNVNAMDTLDFAAGKYTGTITDAAGYVTVNQIFIVDTVKNNFNSIVPKIQGDTAILAQTNAQNLKVNVDLNNLIGLGNNLNYVWTYTQNPAVIVNSLSSETNANTNTIKVNGNVSGTINLQVLVYTGTCSTSVSAPYKIHVKPNIVRNGTKSTGTKIYYNLIGSSPFRIDMTIDSVSTTKLITENEFSIDLLNIKSIGVISIQDSLGVIYYANINEENKAGFVLYNAFSPNNDNKNETFEFGNYMYDNNTKFIKHPWILKIYDRNGFEVFRDDEYKNDWNGGDLVDGVYFWVFINPKVATERLGGFVEIRR